MALLSITSGHKELMGQQLHCIQRHLEPNPDAAGLHQTCLASLHAKCKLFIALSGQFITALESTSTAAAHGDDKGLSMWEKQASLHSVILSPILILQACIKPVWQAYMQNKTQAVHSAEWPDFNSLGKHKYRCSSWRRQRSSMWEQQASLHVHAPPQESPGPKGNLIYMSGTYLLKSMRVPHTRMGSSVQSSAPRW